MSLHSAKLFFLFCYVTIRKIFGLYWLRFNKWMLQSPKFIQPTQEYLHKVVVIGDGFAEGFGDHIVFGSCGGICEYMKNFLHKEKEKYQIRHKWLFLNCGVTNSTSADWLPGAKSGLKLFEKTFQKSAYSDAEIICVVVGSMDAKSDTLSAEQTANNLRSICDALRKKGKKVCLSSLGNAGHDNTGETQASRNKLIKKLIDSTSYDDIPIIAGGDLNAPRFRKADALAFDGIHLHSKSYRLLSRDFLTILAPMMTATEWKVWKEKLSSVTIDPAIYG